MRQSVTRAAFRCADYRIATNSDASLGPSETPELDDEDACVLALGSRLPLYPTAAARGSSRPNARDSS